MPVIVKIEQNGATPQMVQNRLTRIIDRLSRPDPTQAVKKVGDIWAMNYKTEGSYVGGWANLAYQTIRDREARGYGGEHPIMIRRGSLYAMSALFFAQGQPGSASASTNSSGNTATTNASLSIVNGTATLSLSGPLVKHQFGDPSTNLPARPYWFTNKQVVLAARLGVLDWIKREVVT